MLALSVSGHWLVFSGILLWLLLVAIIWAFVGGATHGDDDESTGPRP